MKNKLLVLILISVSTAGFSQSRNFMFKRKLAPVPTEGWYTLPIPATLFAKINKDYSDIRILAVSNDTTEMPFMIRTRENEYAEEVITLPERNKSKKGGKLFVTFELPKDQSVNYLTLSFQEENFNGLVTLEGSADEKEWFEIIKDYRILSIHDQQVDFKATTVSFPPTNYRFLRASLQTDQPTTFITASFEKRSIKEGTFQTIRHQLQTTEDKRNKQTQYLLWLDHYQPVSRINFSINHTQDYYRAFSIEALRDSARTDKGWNYNYETVYSGYLTSLRKNDFEFSTTLTSKLRVTVYNADNAPLTLTAAEVSGPVVEIILPLKPGNDYSLFYGNKNLYAPSYDLVHFKDQIPSSFTALKTLQEEKIGKTEEAESPLIENKVWLWLAMGFAIGLMGYFTLKMMKSKA